MALRVQYELGDREMGFHAGTAENSITLNPAAGQKRVQVDYFAAAVECVVPIRRSNRTATENRPEGARCANRPPAISG